MDKILSFSHNLNTYCGLTFRADGKNSTSIVPKGLPITDKFIHELEICEDKRTEGSKYARLTRSITSIYISCGLALLYELFLFLKIKKMNKSQLEKYKKVLIPQLLSILPATFLVHLGLQKYMDRFADKDMQKTKKMFNELNTNTSAELAARHFRSGAYGGGYIVPSGRIELNKDYMDDPLARKWLKKLLKHELCHAKQFEMIACLDDGIRIMNHAYIKAIAEGFKNSLSAQQELRMIKHELDSDAMGIYDNVTIVVQGVEHNLKQYVNAVIMFLDNENIDMHELPMLFNEEHYNAVRAKRGNLSEEDKKQAEAYLDAYLKYPELSPLNIYNPFGDYRKNLLEKEAYKAGKEK